MPTVTSKQGLGNLFGGTIASLNYNFQTSSSPSSATLTLVNESNNFINPSFKEVISIPPFGLKMNVVEFTERKDSKKTVLQVELEEVSSEILDKELVLIYGIHSDLKYNLNNNKYTIVKGSLIPKSYYPESSIFNSFVEFPALRNDFIKNFENGINLIGTARVTHLRKYPVKTTGVDFEASEDNEWITFNGGELSNGLSSYKEDFSYGPNESGKLDIKFGYTLKNLYKLIKSKGLKFENSSIPFMEDEAFFFSEAGTLREVLSSCLSKLGRSFYVDPFSQEINVISNKDVAEINSLLVSQFSNFTNTSAATQLSLTKSIKDVEANHFVLKGDLDSLTNDRPVEEDPKARKQKLYKLKDEFLIKGLNQEDINLIKVLAPLLFTVKDEQTLDLIVYGLLKSSDSYNGSLYSKEEYCDFKEFVEREKINRNQVVEANTPEWQKSWESLEDQDDEVTIDGFFNYKNAVGAYEQYSGGDESNLKAVIPPSETQLYEIAKSFIEMWAGTYFSVGMTEKEASERSYIPNAKFVGGLLNSFNYAIVNRNDLIAQVPEMQFLYKLLLWANEISETNIKLDYTVGEIADFATKNAIGTGDYIVIAKRNLFGGTEIDSNEIQRTVKQSFLSFEEPEDFKSYLMVTKDALDTVRSIIKSSKKAFERESKKVKDTLIVKYIKTKEDSSDGSNDEASDSGSSEEDSDTLFLRNFQSNVKNFSRRSLTVISSSVFEAKAFLETIDEINPQFQGPFVSTKISYFRPPEISDFDMKKGVDSVSVSISEQGVQTDISYSSRKFAKIDRALISESLGSQSSTLIKKSNPPAFVKNKSRDN